MPAYDLSTQSTKSTMSSEAETLSMDLQEICRQPNKQNCTIHIESQQILSSNVMDTPSCPMPDLMATPTSTNVNYVINFGVEGISE